MADLYVDEARKRTAERLEEVRESLSSANELVASKACVYATGSFGRLEASEHSDLDVFIVVDVNEAVDGRAKLALDGIDQIKLKYQLIQVVDDHDIEKFDAGGKYLAVHPITSFTEWLGSDQDDYRNTLTARLLMLLESKCLVGEETYAKAIDQVVTKYFRDFDNHKENFLPAFLFNDILRMWRTFCVNYEFSRKGGDSREKIKNLKLKFSRMLTCYSAVIYLLALFSRNNTVLPADVTSMVALSPTERLEAVSQEEFWNGKAYPEALASVVQKALAYYSDFLELTHKPTKKAAKLYAEEEKAWREKSYAFGEALAQLIDQLAGMSAEAARLRRLILI